MSTRWGSYRSIIGRTHWYFTTKSDQSLIGMTKSIPIPTNVYQYLSLCLLPFYSCKSHSFASHGFKFGNLIIRCHHYLGLILFLFRISSLSLRSAHCFGSHSVINFYLNRVFLWLSTRFRPIVGSVLRSNSQRHSILEFRKFRSRKLHRNNRNIKTKGFLLINWRVNDIELINSDTALRMNGTLLLNCWPKCYVIENRSQMRRTEE